MLLILVPTTCNSQNCHCRQHIKYACDLEPKQESSESESESVTESESDSELVPQNAARHNFHHPMVIRSSRTASGQYIGVSGTVLNCVTAFETQTQPDTKHGKRKRHLVVGFLPVRCMRLTFCGRFLSIPFPFLYSLKTKFEIFTTQHSSTLIFQFHRIFDRQPRPHYFWLSPNQCQRSVNEMSSLLLCHDFIAQSKIFNNK